MTGARRFGIHRALKAASFEYAAPRTVEEVLALLSEYGPDAKVLAGGQSLVPRMAFRLERPRVLVDIGRTGGLDGVQEVDGELSIGARATHRRLELGVSADPLGRLLRLAGSHIGHLPIRVRGTFGGSIAYADPAAEWCLLATTLAARIGIASSRGHRFVEARDFFLTPLGAPLAPGDFFRTASSFMTALEPDELIDRVMLPLLGPGAGVGFAELSRRRTTRVRVSGSRDRDRCRRGPASIPGGWRQGRVPSVCTRPRPSSSAVHSSATRSPRPLGLLRRPPARCRISMAQPSTGGDS